MMPPENKEGDTREGCSHHNRRCCMSGSSKTTTDHDVIRKWAEERGGKPATVERTYSGKGSLVEISWDEWFQKFDEKHLAFLYQDETSGGEQSRFFKLVSRETAESKEHGSSHKSEHKSASKDKEHKSTSKSHK